MDGDGEFVFELNAVAEAVVDVEVGDLIVTGCGVAVADPAEVDLPVFVAGGFGVVGAEGWAALGSGAGCQRIEKEREADASKQRGRDSHLGKLYRLQH